MKKILFSLVSLVAITACNDKDKTAETVVPSEVTTVHGENVAEAQEDLNESVADAKMAIAEAREALTKAQATGDVATISAAQQRLDELQAKTRHIQSTAGQTIRATDGTVSGANSRLNNTVEAAERQLENVENAAERVESTVK